MWRTSLVALAVLAGCSDRRSQPASVPDDGPPPRRVIEHPRSAVYSLPPHRIRTDGMGPYILGQALATVLYTVPSGPGVEVLDIPGVVRLSVIRVEDRRMVVGGDPVATSFVSVLAPEVARTEAGIEVGSARAALIRELGEPVVDPVRVTDPRVVAVAPLPGVRFVVERDRVTAALVATPAPHPAAGSGATPPTASVPACSVDRSAEAASALRTALGGDAARIDCLTATEAVAAVDDEVVVITAGDNGKTPKRLFSLRVPGLVFAGASHASGKDEIVGVTLRRGDKQAVWSVITARWEAGRVTKTFDEPAYELTEQNASWLGVKLEDLELMLEVEARTDMLVASGVLLSRAGAEIRLAAPLVPISLARRRRAVPDPGATGVGDASLQPLGDAAPTPDAGPP
jgi:hypothetical protein